VINEGEKKGEVWKNGSSLWHKKVRNASQVI